MIYEHYAKSIWKDGATIDLRGSDKFMPNIDKYFQCSLLDKTMAPQSRKGPHTTT